MRQNPLHYLTDRQIRLLASAEGLSVAQLLAKYGGIRQRGKASSPAKKRPAPSAKRKVARGQVFKNPSKEQSVYVHHAATEAAARRMLARDCPHSKVVFLERIDTMKWHAVLREKAASARKNPHSEAATAMSLYHSGQASSLQEAWDTVKSGRVVPKNKSSTMPKGPGVWRGLHFRLTSDGSTWLLKRATHYATPAVADGAGGVVAGGKTMKIVERRFGLRW